MCSLVLCAGAAPAQDAPAVETTGPEVRLRLGGLVQPRMSYGWTTAAPNDEARQRVGFGVRRARLRATVTIDERAGAYIQVGGSSGTLRVIDAYVFFQPNKRVRLRMGRMSSAQVRALLLTPSFAIDAVDRAAIAGIWGRNTIGADGRDFGLDLRYRTDQGDATLFIHNGDGSWDRLRGNYREGIGGGQPTGGIERGLTDLAVSFYSTLRPQALPGLDVGGFISYNGSANVNTEAETIGREYISYGAHLYWGAAPGSQRVRLKADVIGIQYETLSGVTPDLRNQHAVGTALLAALRLHRAAELFARAEHYDANVNRDGRGDTYLTGGFSFSLSRLRGRPYSRERFTLGYSALLPQDNDEPTRHLLILQAQIAF